MDSAYYSRGKLEGMSFTLGAKGDTASKGFYRDGKLDSSPGKQAWPYPRSTESILKTIRKHTPGLRRTYNAHLASRRFGGKVTLQFRIRPDGRLDHVLPIGDTTKNPRFVRDIIDSVKDWKFEAFANAGMDVVSVPFTFSE